MLSRLFSEDTYSSSSDNEDQQQPIYESDLDSDSEMKDVQIEQSKPQLQQPNTEAALEEKNQSEPKDIEDEVEEKLTKLKQTQQQLDQFKWRLSSFQQQYEKLLTKSCAGYWVHKAALFSVNDNTFNALANEFTTLEQAKFRTRTGLIVENLMKLLCDLDQVQSNGNMEVRNRRRNQVKLINGELLPQADAAFSKAKKLVLFTERLQKQLNNIQMTIQQAKNKSRSCWTEKQEAPEEEAPEEEEEEEEELQYTTRETERTFNIYIKLPTNESFKDVEFNLKSESELVVSGKKFQLPIQVNPDNANLEGTTYQRKANGVLQVSIPKRYIRRQRVHAQPPRRTQRHGYGYGYGYEPSYYNHLPRQHPLMWY